MKIGAKDTHKQNKKHVISIVMLAFVLSTLGIISLSKHIWANGTNMTRIQFSHALFCQRVSQAINDSLGDGMADGSDCVNFNLYVSSAEIGNIKTLNIVPPEGGFGNIDWESQSISIAGDWVNEFYNLNSLSITNMHVQNISPLADLSSNLTYLNLANNRINDISPLESLKDKLTTLDLSGNPISEGLDKLSKFTKLTNLSLARTDIGDLGALFYPAEVEYDETTGEPLTEEESSSKLAKVLQVFDISNNTNMSYEKTENTGQCEGSLMPLMSYAGDLVMTELSANNDSLNADDLVCISALNTLQKLDISNNHIDDFSHIKDKSLATLKADSQVFTREIESLDYSPLPPVFTQAGQENYFTNVASDSNTAVSVDQLDLNNAQFNGTKVRFVNAAIASRNNDEPQPATVTIPSGSGAFENTKLQVYFTGQVVTFNDTALCNSVYYQGLNKFTFTDTEGNSSWSPDSPVVLTNACDAQKKQIAMVSGGSDQFLRLTLDEINDDSTVDLTGLEEFSALQVLSLQNNNIADLDKISNASQLRQLYLNDNNLSNDDWPAITDHLASLVILSLNNNRMSTIPTSLANLHSLGNLYLVNNGISDVSPLAYAPTLTVLDLSENSGITDFSGMVQDGSACNPSILKIENAGVTQLPSANIIAEGFSNLTSLNLNGNHITDSAIANLASAQRLEELYLERNQIADTSGFEGITSLKKLFLNNNQIVNVTGLISLNKLAELHLNSNQIADITDLNTLPALATLDLKNQTLTGVILGPDKTYDLPAIFSQAKTLTFPRVANFQSAGTYDIVNGIINNNYMTATISDTAQAMTITIPDGGLAGTKATVTYKENNNNNDDDDIEFEGTITDYTNGGATVTATSSNSFTVTSDTACMILWTQNDGTTWYRLNSSPVSGSDNSRAFTIGLDGIQIAVAYVGDVDGNGVANAVDARRIVSARMGTGEALSSLGQKLADVDGNGIINAVDARKIVGARMGTGTISW